MATRQERLLMKSAAWDGDQIVFRPVARPSTPPKWAWLSLVFAQADTGLVQAAGLIGPLSSLRVTVKTDTLDLWREVRARLRLMLAGALTNSELDIGEVPEGVLTLLFELAGEDGMRSDTDMPTLASVVTNLIRADLVAVRAVKPFSLRPTSPEGIPHYQAVTELTSARYLLQCRHCDRVFLHDGARPAAFCGGACRKAASVAGDQGGGE